MQLAPLVVISQLLNFLVQSNAPDCISDSCKVNGQIPFIKLKYPPAYPRCHLLMAIFETGTKKISVTLGFCFQSRSCMERDWKKNPKVTLIFALLYGTE